MKMKTPLQELIKFIESNDAFEIQDAYKKAKELLPKEKEVICKAWRNGKSLMRSEDAEQYYTQTFTNQTTTNE